MADMEQIKALVLQVMEKKQKRMMMKDLLKEVKKLDDTVEKRTLEEGHLPDDHGRDSGLLVPAAPPLTSPCPAAKLPRVKTSPLKKTIFQIIPRAAPRLYGAGIILGGDPVQPRGLFLGPLPE